ncbi:3-hydroxybutyryl-CoA dehydrogenase [Streptomyces sp. NPDC020298]|uniref:3-hydroxybutyryl-CoA dehydrogenase n=1 Tax=Streptomyces sp. NPDC020298 TaxID=3155010 RepID=UPI0033D7FFCB
MQHQPITRLGIVGSGTMGAGIAELCAVRGLDVRLMVSRESSLIGAPRRIAESLDRRVAKGKLDNGARDDALARIHVTTDLGELADRHLVVEAAREDGAVKREIFGALDKAVPPETILASTTSSLSIATLARAVSRPERVIGMHFFNPVSTLRLVEIVPALLSDEAICARVEQFATDVLDKTCVRTTDRSGFVVNALLIPYLLAAVRMVEEGVASPEQVDLAMELGCAHPMGPLRLADLIGLDVVAAIAGSLHEEFKQPHYAAPPSLLRLVETGWHGRKSGRGFYVYS